MQPYHKDVRVEGNREDKIKLGVELLVHALPQLAKVGFSHVFHPLLHVPAVLSWNAEQLLFAQHYYSSIAQSAPALGKKGAVHQKEIAEQENKYMVWWGADTEDTAENGI